MYVHQWFLEFELVIISSSANPLFWNFDGTNANPARFCEEITVQNTHVSMSPKGTCSVHVRASAQANKEMVGGVTHVPAWNSGRRQQSGFLSVPPFAAACGGPIFDTSSPVSETERAVCGPRQLVWFAGTKNSSHRSGELGVTQ